MNQRSLLKVMTRPLDYTAIACSILALTSQATAEIVERRGSVTYHGEDWRGPDSKSSVDIRPQPSGGMKAFLARLDYPADLRRSGITGVVRVAVAMDARGQITSAEIIQKVHPSLDNIVLRAVRTSKWTPAIKNGKSVPWKFSFPVTFRYAR